MTGKNKAILYVAALLILGFVASELGLNYGLKNPKIPNLYAPSPQEHQPGDRMLKVVKPDRAAVIDGVIVVKKETARPINPFLLQDDIGHQLDSAKLKGNLTLLYFWESHSRSALNELPEIDAAAKKYAARGLKVYGVAVKTTRQEYADFMKEHSFSFPSWLLDGESPVPLIFAPTTLLIDAEGRVRVYVYEQLDNARREKVIEYLLNETAAPAAAKPS